MSATDQLSLWGGETGGDLHLEVERAGFAVIEHGIPSELIDDLQSAHAFFHDNLPDPEPDTLNDMMVDLKDLDRLDFTKDTQNEWHKYRTNTPQFAKPDGYTNRFNQAEALQLAGRKVLNIKTGLLETIHVRPQIIFPLHAPPSTAHKRPA